MLRFHTQTAGVQLTAQQPEVNLVRVAVQGLGAVLGGTQSLHTNSYDEAIALPTEKAARLALRTQQVLAYETDLTATVDPFAGSYVVEAMTDEIEARRGRPDGAGRRLRLGGRRDRGRVPEARDRDVGVPDRTGDRLRARVRWSASTGSRSPRRSRTSRCGSTRRSRPSRWRGWRSCAPIATTHAVRAALASLRDAAAGTDNVLYPMREALRARATVGEVSHALRDVWGLYRPNDRF